MGYSISAAMLFTDNLCKFIKRIHCDRQVKGKNMLNGINHLTLAVTDLEKVLVFINHYLV